MVDFSKKILAFTLLLGTFGPEAFGANALKPGDSGSIIFPIENLPTSAAIAVQVRIVPGISPTGFSSEVTIDFENSTLGPIGIFPGDANDFSVKYAVSPGAPEGNFNIILAVAINSLGVLPPPIELGPTVNFLIDKSPPSLGASLPTQGEILSNPRPLIRLTLEDFGSGISTSTIRLFIDGAENPPDSIAPGSAIVSFTPKGDLIEGPHTAAVTVEDLAGNELDTRSAPVTFEVRLDEIPPQVRLIDDDFGQV